MASVKRFCAGFFFLMTIGADGCGDRQIIQVGPFESYEECAKRATQVNRPPEKRVILDCWSDKPTTWRMEK